MQASAMEDADIQRQLDQGRTLLGPGWRCVESLDDVDDEEYEEEEEEEYVVIDLGTAMDHRTLQTEATYQLIGMDTPMPFLKIGDRILQGAVTPLIGDEVIFDVVRQEEDPQRPHHRPTYKTNNRIQMRGITLSPRLKPYDPTAQPRTYSAGTHAPSVLTTAQTKISGELERGMFPSREWRRRVVEEDSNAMDVDSQNNTPGPSSVRQSAVAEATPEVVHTPAAADETPAQKKVGRPRGSTARTALAVSTMDDLADIHRAGGLGEVRLEISEFATPELLAAVSSVRGGKTSTPGVRLSRAQEERLVRGLPGSGPGSRGGRGSYGYRPTSTRGARGRGGGPRGVGMFGEAMASPAPSGEEEMDPFAILPPAGSEQTESEQAEESAPRPEEADEELHAMEDD